MVLCGAQIDIPYGVVAILIWYLKPTGHKFLDLKNVWTETFFQFFENISQKSSCNELVLMGVRGAQVGVPNRVSTLALGCVVPEVWLSGRRPQLAWTPCISNSARPNRTFPVSADTPIYR